MTSGGIKVRSQTLGQRIPLWVDLDTATPPPTVTSCRYTPCMVVQVAHVKKGAKVPAFAAFVMVSQRKQNMGDELVKSK